MSDEFLACDWGTTHLRIQCFDRSSGSVIAETHSADGAARLAGEATGDARAALYCRTLAGRIAELELQAGRSLAALPIVISGMASSSIGWQELPYARLPFALDGSGAVWSEMQMSADELISARRGPVFLVSGARSDCDVMRGEETQILGLAKLLTRKPDHFNLSAKVLVLLPGTHSKHIELAGGAMVGFRTFMTGELYSLLGSQSVLRHSVELGPQAAPLADPPLGTAFAAGVRRGAADGLSASLFQVRTRQLLLGCQPNENGAFLSGLLVGDELASVLTAAAIKKPIILAAGGSLAAAYHAALDILGAGDRCTLLDAADVRRLAPLGQSLLLAARE